MVQSVPEFYAGQKILVTGGTGFMGKVLIEKLLRSCPEVDTIYMIIRSKKGKSIEERWKDITNLPLFEKLKSIRPESLNKVKLIPGELSRDDLGISDEDKKILQDNVTLVFHVAADVQFSESINDALVQNVKGTKVFIDFALTMKQLKAFLYMSTAYCNFNRPPSESVEKVLPACQDWRTLLKIQETEPATLQLLKEKLLCGHPNPYTWSKSLAEQIVKEYSEYFPTVILRPALVMGTVKDDPIVGWADSLNGFTAIGLGIYLGVLRILKSDEDCCIDFISVDTATRAQLVAVKKAYEQHTRLDVYNCGTAVQHAFTMRDMTKYAFEVERRYPMPQKVWKISCLYTKNDYLFAVMFIIRQVLPSLFMDFCLKIAGQKTIFTKIAIKAANGTRVFGKFSTLQIKFPIDNYLKLDHYLDEKDKTDFSTDLLMFKSSTDEVFTQMSLGLFKYILKEDLSEEAIERNRKRLNRIFFIRYIVKTIQYSTYGFILWKLLWRFILSSVYIEGNS